MSRIRLLIVALGAAVALVVPTTATTASEATPTLTGTVGPGFTITLKKGTTKVRTLKAGTYKIRVTDKSNIHDFKLKGSTRKTITTVAFKGTKTVTVKLNKGTVTYFCSPHATMHEGHVPGHLGTLSRCAGRPRGDGRHCLRRLDPIGSGRAADARVFVRFSARRSGSAFEAEARIRRLFCAQELLDVFGQGRPVLEAVTGAAAQEPDALVLGVWRDQEVLIRSQRVGARTGPDEGAVCERGKPTSQVLAGHSFLLGRDDTVVARPGRTRARARRARP